MMQKMLDYHSITLRILVGLGCILAFGFNSSAQHSVTIGWTQPSQSAGETVASTQISRNNTVIATVPPTTLSYVDSAVTAGQTITYSILNTDSQGIFSAAVTAAPVTIPGGVTPQANQTLLTTQTPVANNNSDGTNVNYELGTKFQSNTAGQITAIRFWKASNETGTHAGHIWSSSGVSLATVNFTGETASGWQQQALATALPILASTTYTVSVNTGATYYVDSNTGFSSQIVSGNLKSVVGNNGTYGGPGKFPTGNYLSSNYFRDVVFVAGTVPPPSMTISCPSASTGVVNLPTGPYSISVTSGTTTASCTGMK
jgi:hypothetical protein